MKQFLKFPGEQPIKFLNNFIKLERSPKPISKHKFVTEIGVFDLSISAALQSLK